jgi:hypothetical protein
VDENDAGASDDVYMVGRKEFTRKLGAACATSLEFL